MSEVERLDARVRSLRLELIAAKRQLHEAQMSERNVKIGDLVRSTRDGSIGRICSVEFTSWGKVWVTVNPRKKSGEFSANIRQWMDYWEPVTGTDRSPHSSPQSPHLSETEAETTT